MAFAATIFTNLVIAHRNSMEIHSTEFNSGHVCVAVCLRFLRNFSTEFNENLTNCVVADTKSQRDDRRTDVRHFHIRFAAFTSWRNDRLNVVCDDITNDVNAWNLYYVVYHDKYDYVNCHCMSREKVHFVSGNRMTEKECYWNQMHNIKVVNVIGTCEINSAAVMTYHRCECY